jgi:scyllo-inositol 2-dehydrogenase (NADP+)
MTIINAALCSFGMSGRVFHAPFITLHPQMNLIGAWERSKYLINEHYPTAKSYPSYEDLLADNTVQLVVVNTPTYTHYEYAKQALLSGKHIVVEKAFTTTVAEAEELKAIATERGLIINVFQNRRWDSDFSTVKSIVDKGVLGEINEAEFRFDRFNLNLSPKGHKEDPGPGAGIVKDLGPHIIDQALYLFGMPSALFADIRTTRPTSVVDDCFEILLYYPTMRVRLKAGYIVKEALPSYIVHGKKGSFVKNRADVQEPKLLLNEKPNLTDWGTEPETEKGILNLDDNGTTIRNTVPTLKGNYYHFYDGVYQSIANNKPPVVSADDGINVMKIIESAFQSSKEGKVISL